jgi:hypothetical protein
LHCSVYGRSSELLASLESLLLPGSVSIAIPTIALRMGSSTNDVSTALLLPLAELLRLVPFLAGSALFSLLGPVLNASGCRLICLAPFSNARFVWAMYSSLEGAARSVFKLRRPD